MAGAEFQTEFLTEGAKYKGVTATSPSGATARTLTSIQVALAAVGWVVADAADRADPSKPVGAENPEGFCAYSELSTYTPAYRRRSMLQTFKRDEWGERPVYAQVGVAPGSMAVLMTIINLLGTLGLTFQDVVGFCPGAGFDDHLEPPDVGELLEATRSGVALAENTRIIAQSALQAESANWKKAIRFHETVQAAPGGRHTHLEVGDPARVAYQRVFDAAKSMGVRNLKGNPGLLKLLSDILKEALRVELALDIEKGPNINGVHGSVLVRVHRVVHGPELDAFVLTELPQHLSQGRRLRSDEDGPNRAHAYLYKAFEQSIRESVDRVDQGPPQLQRHLSTDPEMAREVRNAAIALQYDAGPRPIRFAAIVQQSDLDQAIATLQEHSGPEVDQVRCELEQCNKSAMATRVGGMLIFPEVPSKYHANNLGMREFRGDYSLSQLRPVTLFLLLGERYHHVCMDDKWASGLLPLRLLVQEAARLGLDTGAAGQPLAESSHMDRDGRRLVVDAMFDPSQRNSVLFEWAEGLWVWLDRLFDKVLQSPEWAALRNTRVTRPGVETRAVQWTCFCDELMDRAAASVVAKLCNLEDKVAFFNKSFAGTVKLVVQKGALAGVRDATVDHGGVDINLYENPNGWQVGKEAFAEMTGGALDGAMEGRRVRARVA